MSCTSRSSIYLNREAQLGLWEYIHAHDSMIDEVRGNNYYSEPIAFELDDSDIKETIRPYAMGKNHRRGAVYITV